MRGASRCVPDNIQRVGRCYKDNGLNRLGIRKLFNPRDCARADVKTTRFCMISTVISVYIELRSGYMKRKLA